MRLAVAAAFGLATFATAANAAAPVHPPRVPVARDGDSKAVTLAGSKLAWIGTDRNSALQLWWSDGGPARRLQRVSPAISSDDYGDWEEVSLAGSTRELAWRHASFVDNRLSVDDTTRYFVRDRAKTRVYSNCYNGAGLNAGIDVDGRVVALGRGACSRGDQITLLDFARSRTPEVTRVTARYPTGGVRLAGRYVAWREFEFFIDRIVVWDWRAGREAYRFVPPGEQGLTFDLQADGRIVLTYQPDFTRAVGRLGWYSPQENSFHELPGTPDFSGIHAVGDRFAYTRVGVTPHERAFPFVVENMQGQITHEIAAPRRAYLQDFDGTCAAWSDATPQRGQRGTRLFVAPVPAVTGVDERSACAFVRLPSSTLQRRGRVVSIPLQCRTSSAPGCRGFLGATADGGKLAARVRFRLKPGQTRTYRMRVPRSVLGTRHSRAKLRLRAWAIADPLRGVGAAVRRTVVVVPAPRR